MKHGYVYFLVCCVLIISIAAACLLTGCKSFDDTKKEGKAEKRTSLTINDDGSFRIMQLTDLHLTSNGSYKKDYQTLTWVEEAITTYKPDLVEVTGDAVGGDAKKRNKAILALANIFEKHQVYWAYTFGNHDGEHSLDGTWAGKEGAQNDLLEYCSAANSTIDKSKVNKIFYGENATENANIYELLQGYEYSLLARSAEEISSPAAMGVGNYVIELKNNKDEVVYAVFHMDMHGKMYIDPVGNTKGADGYVDAGYVGLTDMQVQWYKDTVNKYAEKGIPSALFMHVPHYAYREAVEQNSGMSDYGVPEFEELNDLENKLNAQGMLLDKYADYGFVKQEGVYAPRWDDGLADVMNEYVSTNLVSVGHDHNNSFVINYSNDGKNPVLFAYGRTSGVNAWARDIPVGATVFDINFSAYDPLDPQAMYNIVWEKPSFEYDAYGNR